MRLFACLLFATAAAAQMVEGTIVDATTGRGIPRARVILQKAGERAGQPLYRATADSEGRFRIEDVQEGAYTPRYAADRFFPVNAPGPEIQVAAGTPVHLEARLVPNVHVTGRVLDGRGDPVPGARIDLTLPQTFWTAVTDSHGRFDIDSVIAGASDYRLSATPPAAWKPPEAEADTHEPRAWARTFYPAAIRRADSAPLAVSPGVDLRDLEVRLLAVPVHAVRGILLNADGAPAAKTALTIWDAVPGRNATYKAESQPDGSFEFPAVAEGEWCLTSSSGNLRVQNWIDLNARDLDVGKLRLAPPFTLRGRVVLDVPPGMPASRGFVVMLMPQRAGRLAFGGLVHDTVPYPDGTFRFDNVYAGSFLIRPGEPPPLLYLDSVSLGDARVEGEVVLSAASPEVTIVYKTNGGTVRGTVENCAGGKVLLRPQAGPDWASHTGSCDSAGRFEIAGLKPGEYDALAFAADRPVTPETARPFLAGAARIAVRPGEVTRADLKLSGVR
jgi:Carboxypeptidase regulatory-like domain